MFEQNYEDLLLDAKSLAIVSRGTLSGALSIVANICDFIKDVEKCKDIDDLSKIRLINCIGAISSFLTRAIDAKYGMPSVYGDGIRSEELNEAKQELYKTVIGCFKEDREKLGMAHHDYDIEIVTKIKMELLSLSQEIRRLKKNISLYKAVKAKTTEDIRSYPLIDESRTEEEKRILRINKNKTISTVQSMMRQHNIATIRNVKKLRNKNEAIEKAIYNTKSQIEHYASLLMDLVKHYSTGKDGVISIKDDKENIALQRALVFDEFFKLAKVNAEIMRSVFNERGIQMQLNTPTSQQEAVSGPKEELASNADEAPKEEERTDFIEKATKETPKESVEESLEQSHMQSEEVRQEKVANPSESKGINANNEPMSYIELEQKVMIVVASDTSKSLVSEVNDEPQELCTSDIPQGTERPVDNEGEVSIDEEDKESEVKDTQEAVDIGLMSEGNLTTEGEQPTIPTENLVTPTIVEFDVIMRDPKMVKDVVPEDLPIQEASQPPAPSGSHMPSETSEEVNHEQPSCNEAVPSEAITCMSHYLELELEHKGADTTEQENEDHRSQAEEDQTTEQHVMPSEHQEQQGVLEQEALTAEIKTVLSSKIVSRQGVDSSKQTTIVSAGDIGFAPEQFSSIPVESGSIENDEGYSIDAANLNVSEVTPTESLDMMVESPTPQSQDVMESPIPEEDILNMQEIYHIQQHHVVILKDETEIDIDSGKIDIIPSYVNQCEVCEQPHEDGITGMEKKDYEQSEKEQKESCGEEELEITDEVSIPGPLLNEGSQESKIQSVTSIPSIIPLPPVGRGTSISHEQLPEVSNDDTTQDSHEGVLALSPPANDDIPEGHLEEQEITNSEGIENISTAEGTPIRGNYAGNGKIQEELRSIREEMAYMRRMINHIEIHLTSYVPFSMRINKEVEPNENNIAKDSSMEMSLFNKETVTQVLEEVKGTLEKKVDEIAKEVECNAPFKRLDALTEKVLDGISLIDMDDSLMPSGSITPLEAADRVLYTTLEDLEASKHIRGNSGMKSDFSLGASLENILTVATKGDDDTINTEQLESNETHRDKFVVERNMTTQLEFPENKVESELNDMAVIESVDNVISEQTGNDQPQERVPSSEAASAEPEMKDQIAYEEDNLPITEIIQEINYSIEPHEKQEQGEAVEVRDDANENNLETREKREQVTEAIEPLNEMGKEVKEEIENAKEVIDEVTDEKEEVKEYTKEENEETEEGMTEVNKNREAAGAMIDNVKEDLNEVQKESEEVKLDNPQMGADIENSNRALISDENEIPREEDCVPLNDNVPLSTPVTVATIPKSEEFDKDEPIGETNQEPLDQKQEPQKEEMDEDSSESEDEEFSDYGVDTSSDDPPSHEQIATPEAPNTVASDIELGTYEADQPWAAMIGSNKMEQPVDGAESEEFDSFKPSKVVVDLNELSYEILKELEEIYTMIQSDDILGLSDESLFSDQESTSSEASDEALVSNDSSSLKQEENTLKSTEEQPDEISGHYGDGNREEFENKMQQDTILMNDTYKQKAQQDQNTLNVPLYIGVFSPLISSVTSMSDEALKKNYEEFQLFKAFLKMRGENITNLQSNNENSDKMGEMQVGSSAIGAGLGDPMSSFFGL